jgi:hypothetical protein
MLTADGETIGFTIRPLLRPGIDSPRHGRKPDEKKHILVRMALWIVEALSAIIWIAGALLKGLMERIIWTP